MLGLAGKKDPARARALYQRACDGGEISGNRSPGSGRFWG
jgi:hypothetical protein